VVGQLTNLGRFPACSWPRLTVLVREQRTATLVYREMTPTPQYAWPKLRNRVRRYAKTFRHYLRH